MRHPLSRLPDDDAAILEPRDLQNLHLALLADVEQVDHRSGMSSAAVEPAEPVEAPPGMNIADLMPWAVLVILLLVGQFVLRKILKWRNRRPQVVEPELKIDVSTLDCAGPPAEGPMLEFYNIPVRLAVLVLAPLGRGHEFPPSEEIPAVVDMVLPGLSRIVDTHRPLYHRWPVQLSWRGFTHQFFANVRLPGDDGRGTPWSSVAGIVKTGEGAVMAGLVLRSEQATGFGRETIEKEGGWLRVLRIRSGE